MYSISDDKVLWEKIMCKVMRLGGWGKEDVALEVVKEGPSDKVTLGQGHNGREG